MSIVKDDLLYSKDHEWIKIENNYVLVGISDYAQHSLGDIVYLDVKEINTNLEIHDSIGTIESVKAAEDIYSPVSGTIIERNEEIIKKPESINKDPYNSWIVKIHNFKKEDIEKLMNAHQYKEYLATLEQE